MKALRIALIGYGRMGKMIERIALERGHTIAVVIDEGAQDGWTRVNGAGVDVAIEFTRPSVAFGNCVRCIDSGVPVVSGTTGWAEELKALRYKVAKEGGAGFCWASNFSIGVNLFMEINRKAAALMRKQPQYLTSITETHHIHKLDAPSGTAITLAEELLGERPDLEGWAVEGEATPGLIPIASIREGEVPGIHTVAYTSEVDSITLTHQAFKREGFALGAVIAAEYMAQHPQSTPTMADILASL